MNKKITIIGILIILLAVFATGCVEQPTPPAPPLEPPAPPLEPQIEKQEIIIAGSTSVYVVTNYLADAFMKKHPNVSVKVISTGSTAGIVGAYEGIVNIGMSSRNLRDDELRWGLNESIICYDAIAVVVHPENPVTGITMEDLKRIFIGEITNWNEVGGPNKSITVVIREEGSGTRGAFEDLVHRGINPIGITMPGTGRIKTRVSMDRYAIGYITVSALDKTVSPLNINGVSPTASTVLDGTYKIARPFIFLTKGTARPLEQKFIDFVLGPFGQNILEEKGMVRVN